MTISDPRPDFADRNAAALRDELRAELHVLDTAWRRPTCGRLCAPLMHTLTCELLTRCAVD